MGNDLKSESFVAVQFKQEDFSEFTKITMKNGFYEFGQNNLQSMFFRGRSSETIEINDKEWFVIFPTRFQIVAPGKFDFLFQETKE